MPLENNITTQIKNLTLESNNDCFDEAFEDNKKVIKKANELGNLLKKKSN